MAIKNKDGSTYGFTKPPPQMAEQVFWDKEKIVMHNKFGMRYLRERKEEDEIDLSRLRKEIKIPEMKSGIKIVEKIQEYKPKQLAEDVIEAWCLPCAKIIENHDPLYDERYDKIEYGETFIFKTRLLALEDLSIKFITDIKIDIPDESVVYPITASRRWWRIKGHKDVEDTRIYLGTISDYQPNFNR